VHRRRWRFALLLGVAAIAAALVVGVLVFRGREQQLQAGSERIRLLAPPRRRPLAPLEGAALLPPPARVVLLDGGRRPAFVDVWASWCIACRQEAAALGRLWRRFGVRIRFVGVDSQDSWRPARAFVRRYGLGFPQLFDPKATAAARLGVFGIPTAFLVDRHGRVAATIVGKRDEATFAQALEELTRER